MSDYYTLKVKEVVNETADTVTIHFKQPLFKKVKYKSGQFLTLIVPINGKKERRSYSMSSAPSLDNTVAISVKRVEGGLVSNYLNDNVQAGDTIEVMEPLGNFVFEPDKKRTRHLVLFGGGSGITPLISMLKTALFLEPNSTVSLVYCNRSEDSIIFAKQLDDLKVKFGDRLNIVHNLTKPGANWGGYSGRLDDARTVNILNLLPKLPAEDTEYYLCGPEGMMDAVKTGLKTRKVSASKIHTESFVSTITAEELAEATGDIETQTVKIIMDGQTHEVLVRPNQSILEAGLDDGLDMPFSCQSGLCTACMGKCKAGTIKMIDADGISEDEINKGYVLLCVGHPLTADVEVEIE